MDWHATLIRNAIGPLWARWEGSPYLKHYRRLLQTQYDDPQTIRSRQWGAVSEMLRHAYATVPYYRERFDREGIDPAQIRDYEDFCEIPVVTKSDIRAHGDRLLSEQFHRDQLHAKKTSGSTGVGLEVWVDPDSAQFKRACTLRSDEWSGWRFGEPIAAIWGNPEYLKRGWRGHFRNAVLERTIPLDTLQMDEPTLERFACRLVSRPPSLIFGHAHSLYLFAEYLRNSGHPTIRPRGIISTAMVLHSWQRQTIEEVFACKVTNRYGCEEVSLIACECEEHDGLHINADGVFVEVAHGGKPLGPGEAGSLLVTDLTNRAMPLIRYQVGDVAVMADRHCRCGRGLPLLERLEGREADYVVTRSGKLISGISLTENFANLIPGVAQLQIIQETIDRFRFRIVRSTQFGPESIDRIRELVAERFGPDAEFECEYVDRIPQEPSGKYRFCISKVANPFSRSREVAVS
jgi:phenylacetate-CoA ligase